ncbi:MAG TPA: ribosome small subunit-dependent GTPase A [Vicinamibacterales bacterium]|nr:ribosome small subunit-dependent GTPase A [Vicinamibacterales bacterium]
MPLSALGWTAREEELFRALDEPGLQPGRVAVGYGATFRVYLEEGDTLADVAGRLRHAAQSARDLPAVGDWVAVRWTPPARAIIHAILPRKSLFARKAAGRETGEQLLAANVDTAFLVSGLDDDFNLRRIERYLALTRAAGAAPVIVLNKVDVAPDPEGQRRAVEAIAGGAPVHAISSKQGIGLEALNPYLQPGQTIALLGSSGVGKSTIINRLLGYERQRTGEVRESDHRGRHTTTYRELVPLPGGALLIDTPGMRELHLLDAEGVDEAFEDITSLAAGCRFTDCRHESEPDCAVKAAVEEGRLSAERLAAYHKLQAELAALEARRDVLAREARQQKVRAAHRAMRRMPPKGHRG